MARLETVYRQMREAAEADKSTDLTEGLDQAGLELDEMKHSRKSDAGAGEKTPMKIKTKDALKGNKEGEDLGKAVVSPDEKDSGPSKTADKMKGGLTPAGSRKGDKKQGEVKGEIIKKVGIKAGDTDADEDALSEDELEELDDLLDEMKDDEDDNEDDLDDVNPKAVKKKFKNRKDKDIDNDGDVDDSDKFLHKKRKAISKAVAKDEEDDSFEDDDDVDNEK